MQQPLRGSTKQRTGCLKTFRTFDDRPLDCDVSTREPISVLFVDQSVSLFFDIFIRIPKGIPLSNTRPMYPSRISLPYFFAMLSSAAPRSITSAMFFDDNPAEIRRINQSANANSFFPFAAQDLNEKSAYAYIEDHPSHFGCCVHADLDALIDFGNKQLCL
jgi:hypothetical protein